MARVPYLGDDDLVEPAAGRVTANPIALYRALAHSPGGLDGFARLGSWIRHGSTLDARQRELLILAVGVLAGSEYEYAHHVKIGRDVGCSDEDVRGVLAAARDEPSTLGEVEALLVRAARESTVEGGIGQATFAELAARFGPEQLVEIVLVAAHYAAVVRVLRSLQVDLEPSFQRYLDELPLRP